MTVMNFDLEDGLPPVSFDLNPNDAERFAAFMAECHEALVAAPTPPTQTMPLETLVAEIESDPEMKVALNEARKQDMLEGATVTEITPSQDDEPVAWMDVHDNWDLYKNKPSQVDVVPLYTRPDNSELRKAAWKYLKSNSYGTAEERRRDLENLRAALEGK